MALDKSRTAFRGLAALVALIIGGVAAAYLVDFRPAETGKARRVGPFLATPYLQLGQASGADTMAVLWHGDDRDEVWAVESQSAGAKTWRVAPPPQLHRVLLDGVEPHRVYQADLAGLVPGKTFRYRVSRGGRVAFEAEGHARPAPGQAQRFVAFGDCAAGTDGQRRVAYQTSLVQPDYVVITGDIVYFRGKVAEYRSKFFPIYAAATASPTLGAPLLGSMPFVGVPGNHDLDLHDFDGDSDLMAYYLFWSQPLNGPSAATTTSKLAPRLKGAPARVAAFRAGAGERYPRMANFSFDAGDVHWTVLDSNPYVQWADPLLRDWVARDLAAAAHKPWRFVAFHHPSFHSSKAHNREQQMRLLADVFEHGGVSLVFSGHVHNYQRSRPLRFAATTYPDGRAPEPSTPVAGRWTLDESFDGQSQTQPNGIIYLTTGAGGAKLYDSEQDAQPSRWQPFTVQFRSNVHSLTQVDVTPDAARVRQIDADGAIIDAFTVTQPR